MKTKLKRAAEWFNEHKDKSLDDLLVDNWKSKCSEDGLKRSMDKCKAKGRKKQRKFQPISKTQKEK